MTVQGTRSAVLTRPPCAVMMIPPALPHELRPGRRREIEHAVLSGPKKSLCSSTRISGQER